MNTKLLNQEHNNSINETNEISQILQKLESRQYVENIFKDILSNIKKSTAYVHLKEIALFHFTCIMSEKNESEPNNAIEKKKAQSTQIGFLSDAIGSTITRLVAEKIKSQEVDIRKEVRQIMSDTNKSSAKKAEISDKLPSKRKKTSANATSLKDSEEKSDNEDSDAMENSQSKRVPRSRKPNAKYFSDEIVSSVTDCYFDKLNNEHNENAKSKKRKKL